MVNGTYVFTYVNLHQWRIYIVKLWMPPSQSNLLIFMQFSGNFGQIIGWRTPPLEFASLWEILDPLLHIFSCYHTYQKIPSCRA